MFQYNFVVISTVTDILFVGRDLCDKTPGKYWKSPTWISAVRGGVDKLKMRKYYRWNLANSINNIIGEVVLDCKKLDLEGWVKRSINALCYGNYDAIQVCSIVF
jgi:hypothetical protein